MKDNQLTLIFSATNCSGWPKLKFYMDDDLYEDFIFTGPSTTINLPLSLLDGDHELAIELYGKTTQNTLLENGKIVSDQTVTLEKILIDNIMVPDIIKYSGIHYYHGQSHPQSLTWGPNGVWKLKFKTPIIDWVLAEKEKNNFAYQANGAVLGDYNKLKKQKLVYYLEQIEDLLKNE